MSGIDFTVGVVVERPPGEFLMIEERVAGQAVLTQPGGHLEAGESLAAAVERETLEESGCRVRTRRLIELYQWYDEAKHCHYLRAMYAAELLEQKDGARLDEGVVGVRWMTRAEIDGEIHRHRNPVVQRVLHDYLRGRRIDDSRLDVVLRAESDVATVRHIATRL
ncbi:MAG: NUDIX domain-containing protein [Woeseiaceae bacterium]|nr:NUDIX domain-containing protein [Woeseiaceae bacterium]